MNVDYSNLKLNELNYNSYLKVPELLALQQRISTPAHHDEMFFIIIHQAAELWFKLLLHETDKLVEALRGQKIDTALKVLKRQTAVMDLQSRQITLLSTLTPAEFAGFRDHLRPASGFQSYQFREMEYRFGIRDEFFLSFFRSMPEVAKKLEGIRKQPAVYDEFVGMLAKTGHTLPAELLKRDVTRTPEPNAELVKILHEVYEKPGDRYEWVLLFEAMLDFDEKFTMWRHNHLIMVERAIGRKTGTGGSTGYNFLNSRVNIKCFPELWEVRNHIGGESY